MTDVETTMPYEIQEKSSFEGPATTEIINKSKSENLQVNISDSMVTDDVSNTENCKMSSNVSPEVNFSDSMEIDDVSNTENCKMRNSNVSSEGQVFNSVDNSGQYDSEGINIVDKLNSNNLPTDVENLSRISEGNVKAPISIDSELENNDISEIVEENKNAEDVINTVNSDSNNKINDNLILSPSEEGNINLDPDEITTEKNRVASRKRFTLIDSDSDEENNSENKKNETNIGENMTEKFNKTNKKPSALIDSDSEEENNENSVDDKVEKDTKEDDKGSKASRKRMTLIDSDSEEEILKTKNINSDTEHTTSNENQAKRKSRLLQICDSDSEDETRSKKDSSNPETVFKIDTDTDHDQAMSRLKNLCDSESSVDDEEQLDHLSTENIIKQKRTKKKPAPTEKKMTGKEALEQRRQILSESQKMVRETRVHLPYHRPKQHTLQDFLKRKSILNKTMKIPTNMPTGLSIKLLNKNLKTAEEKLKEKEKEIEQFYKSESEDEDEPEPEVIKQSNGEEYKNNEDKAQQNENKLEKMEVDEEIQKIALQVTTNIVEKENESIDINHVTEEIEENKTDKNEDGTNKSEENQIITKKNQIITEENQIITEENQIITEENQTITEENQLITEDTQSTVEEEQDKNIEVQKCDESITQEIIIEKKIEGNSEEMQQEVIQNAEENKKLDEPSKTIENFENDAAKEYNTDETQLYKKILEQMEIDDFLDSNENQEKVQNNSDSHTEQNGNQAIISSKGEVDISLDKITDSDKEAKLQELRNILENSIFKQSIEQNSASKNSELDKESSLNDPNSELELNEQNSELGSSQVELSKEIYNAKEERKRKLAEIEAKLKKLNPVVVLKGNLQPRLSGGPNEMIVFDDDIQRSKRVDSLMQRFLNHTTKKQTPKTHEFSILKIEGSNITREIINFSKDSEEDQPEDKIIPGLRIKKLKTELQEQIMKKRMEELKKKQEEMTIDNEEDGTFAGEKEDCGKILDNEEEEELTDPSSASEEEEEEDDMEIVEKPRIKSAFVDEEAEESEDEADVDDNEENEEIENNEDESDDSSDDLEDPEDQESNLDPANKKSLRRIITPADDSDDDTVSRPESTIGEEKINTESSGELFASQENDEFPAYQQPSEGLEKTPCKLATQSKHDFTSLLTPTLNLTALQGMSPAIKPVQESPNVNEFLPPDEPSPLKGHCVKTKLFTDQEDDNVDELENLCSGKFTTQSSKNFTTQESELLNICSGTFSGITQSESSTSGNISLMMKPTQSLDLILNDDSQNFTITIENETTESLSKIEESPLNEENFNKENQKPEENTLKYPKMKIISSSEDEDVKDSVSKKKKLKKKKRRYVIDDISITDEDESDEERLQDFEDEEISKNIDYDSEENEIELVEYEGLEGEDKPVKEATDFFENEAELSESEWGSEDEDEKKLDYYEVEEGDEEKINEGKVQRELERMHMRNILDDDQREVKLLQELLLEDGELHGAGRERKFRWKNADSMAWTAESDKPKDDEEDVEEIESEIQWRKMRHERESFLKEQQEKKSSQQTDEDDFVNDSQLLKLGLKSLNKFISSSSNSSQKKTPVAETVAKSDDIKLPFSFLNKRGSFLQRSETTLTRLAEITKTSSNLGGPKNSKNFVFTSVERTEIEITGEDDDMNFNTKKRKAEEGTPKALKKLRIADMSPNISKRKKKLTPF